MRKAKETDYWDKVYKRKYPISLKKIDLNGLNNINEIELSDGVVVICGLNGAGKSTIISAIKTVIGMPLSDHDIHRINDCSIEGEFRINTQILHCSNREGERCCDFGMDISKVKFLDCDESAKAQQFIIKQCNLEELIEQNEEYKFSEEEIEEINYLTGKRYAVCEVRELEDIEGIGTIPYFQVTVDDIEYNSSGMGSGEHFLLYLFWCINKFEKETILIVEEPETYVSIQSQMHFINYLGKQIAEKGIQVIMTTHSPHLLEHVKNQNIRIISRVGNMTVIKVPDENMLAESILGIEVKCAGTLFVEDKVACDFLSIILEDKAPYILKRYTIEIVSGENAISKCLEFPRSEKIKYNFVGIYDGDMRSRLDISKLQWNGVFLPGEKPLEVLYREYLHCDKHVNSFCQSISKDKDDILTFLSTIDGADYHDWFEELRKHLAVDGRQLVRIFYNLMEMDDAIDVFIDELKKCIEK